MNKSVSLQQWGIVDYKEAWDRQEQLFNETVRIKIANRALPPEEILPTPNFLVFCEHPHVFTLGKSGEEKNLLVDPDQLEQIQATYYKINRGGDITYHGPGQLVAYPILDLDNFFTDIHKYLRFLEEAVIQTLLKFSIKAERYDGYTGVWLDAHDDKLARKICAMGVRCSRWVTMHGLALNVNTDLSFFKNIVACGIEDKKVTSMQAELGKTIDMQLVMETFSTEFAKLFLCHLNTDNKVSHA